MEKQTEGDHNPPWRFRDAGAWSIAGAVANKSIAFLSGRWKWFLISVAALALFQIYFVRELFAAFLFFTIFYLLLVTVVLLYIFFVDGLDQGSAWVGVHVRLFLASVRHHFASPAQVVNTAKHTGLRSARKERSGRNVLL